MSFYFYILKIYSLASSSSVGVYTSSLAEAMHVSPASASEMIQKLVLKGYLRYDKKTGARLTEEGEKIAIQLRRVELLWHKFCVENLQLDLLTGSLYAKKFLEISDECLTNALSTMLGNPLFGVGGIAIPTENGKLDHEKGVKLCDLILPYEGALVGILDSSPSLISYLNLRGLSIGTELNVRERCQIDNSYLLTTKNGACTHTISEKIASFLLIR